MGGEHLAIQFALRPGFGRQGVGAVGQRILRLAADLVGLGHLLGGLPHGETGGVLGHGRGHRQQVLQAQTAQNIETLLEVARLVEIHQGAGQRLADPDGQHGRGVGTAGDGDVHRAGHDGFGDIGHRLETGGAGARHAIGIGADAHASAKHDLPGDVWRFRHLHHLAEHQLVDELGVEIGAGEHLAHHQFAQIHRRHAVKSGGLLGKGGAQTRHDGYPFALASRQFQWLFHPGSLG